MEKISKSTNGRSSGFLGIDVALSGKWTLGWAALIVLLIGVDLPGAGLGETPGTWLRLGTSSGAVATVAISPAQPSRVYAGTADGVYRSDDGGATWSRSSNGLDFSLINCLSIAESPSEVLYAGTAGGGVYRSDDLGASWQVANQGAEGPILAVRALPSDATSAYAISWEVVRTQQGGSYWYSSSVGLGFLVKALALARSDPATLYAVADSPPYLPGEIYTSVYRSLDGGATWSLDADAQPLVLPRFEETALAIDPTDSRVVYVGGKAGLFRRSQDGVWESVSFGDGPTPRVRAVAIAPALPSVILVASDGAFYRSSDKGQTWSEFAPPGGPSNRVHSLEIGTESADTVFAATRFGLFRSSNGGENWELVQQGLPLSSALGFSFDPTSPLTVYINSNRGLIKSTTGGVSGDDPNAILSDYQRADRAEVSISKVWTVAESGVAEVFVDPSNPRRILVASNGLQLSEDGGRTFSRRLDEQVNALAFSKSSPQVLYAATTSGTGVLKSVNGGIDWTPSADGLRYDDFGGPGHPRTIFEVAVDPFDPSVVYAGGLFGVSKSVDGGANWSLPICCPFPTPATAPALFLELTEVVSLAFDPASPGTIYAGLNPNRNYSTPVYKTVDAGQTWQPAFQGLPEGTRVLLAVDPKNPSTVYAGTWGFGVYRSLDGGAHWQPMNQGLDNLFVKSLEFDFSGRLHAGTEGGLFQLQPSPPAEPAPINPIQNVSGNLLPSGEVVLTIGMFRTSPNSTVPVQTTFVETLPQGLTLVDADADRGDLVVGPSLNTVTWTGALAVRQPAEIRLKARIDEKAQGGHLVVQGVAFLEDGAFALSGQLGAPGEANVLDIGNPPLAAQSFFVPAEIDVAHSFVGVATANLSSGSTLQRTEVHTADGAIVSQLDSGPITSFGQTTFIAGIAAGVGDSVLVSGQQSRLDGFFLIGDESLSRLDGVGGRLTDAQTLIFPFAGPGEPGRTIVSLFNPDSISPSKVVLRLRNAAGGVVANSSFEVGSLGTLTSSLSELFPGQVISDGYLVLEADHPVRGFELEATDRSFTAAAAVSPTWSDRLWSPHFFFDGQGTTTIRVINPTASEARLRFHIVDDQLGMIAEPEVTVSAGALEEFDLRTLSGLPPDASRQGYVEIEASGGDLDGVPLQSSLVVSSVYTGFNGEFMSNLPLASRGFEDVAFLQVAQSEDLGLFQGLAIVAPTGADLELLAYDEHGEVTARKELSLPPGGRLASLLNQPDLFGPAFQQSGGILRIRATREVLTYSLFGGTRFLAAIESSPVPGR